MVFVCFCLSLLALSHPIFTLLLFFTPTTRYLHSTNTQTQINSLLWYSFLFRYCSPKKKKDNQILNHMIINTPGDCVPEKGKKNKKKEKIWISSFSPSVRPLNCMADASRRSSSSGKYSFIFFYVFFEQEFLLKRRKTSHFIVFHEKHGFVMTQNKFFSLMITFYSSSGLWYRGGEGRSGELCN